jgi:murein L,D-transpeptidase YafK
MTDDKIKEIYLYAVYARNNGQTNIPAYIFPFKMTDSAWDTYKQKYGDNQELLVFWANLKTGYDTFEKEKKAWKVSVDREGNYVY